jgi:hypothetical protein
MTATPRRERLKSANRKSATRMSCFPTSLDKFKAVVRPCARRSPSIGTEATVRGSRGHADTGFDSNATGPYLYFGFDSQTHAASPPDRPQDHGPINARHFETAQNGITARVSRCPYLLFAQSRVLFSRGVATRIQSWPRLPATRNDNKFKVLESFQKETLVWF